MPFGGIKLLYVSHYAAHKGFEFLLEAVAELKKRRDDFQIFLTVGGGKEEEPVIRLNERAKALGIENQVRFLGQVPSGDIHALYGSVDAFVFPSLCESFGFPLLEAMGHGLPVVASSAAFCEEICAGAALYYPVGDVAAAADCLFQVCEENVREDLARRSQQRYRGRDWSWRHYANDFTRLLSEALER